MPTVRGWLEGSAVAFSLLYYCIIGRIVQASYVARKSLKTITSPNESRTVLYTWAKQNVGAPSYIAQAKWIRGG